MVCFVSGLCSFAPVYFECPAPQDAADDGPSETKLGIAAGRAEVRRRRSKCVGQMQHSARILGRRKSCRLFDGMLNLPKPLEDRFSHEQVAVKTRHGTLTMIQGLAQGGFAGTLQGIMKHFLSPGFAAALGFTTGHKSVHQLAPDQAIADATWLFTVSLVGSLAVSNCKYDVPPQCFIGLTNPDKNLQAEWLAKLSTFTHLSSLGAAGHHDQQVRS